jgi:hypothetical protein
MSQLEQEWVVLSKRISLLTDGAAHVGEHTGLIVNILLPRLEELFADVQSFARQHADELPRDTVAVLEQMLEAGASRIPRNPTAARWLTGVLCLIRSVLDPALAGTEAHQISIVERALLHLQRLMVADPDVQTKWLSAYRQGELSCERLGGAHLLHHGIYPIKSNATGERTDLILGNRLAITSGLRRATEAMALTEWKVIRDPKKSDEIIDQARKQASRYAEGLLAGFQISSVRFLVTVSTDHIGQRDDELVDRVVYRHFNIAVAPSVPSASA